MQICVHYGCYGTRSPDESPINRDRRDSKQTCLLLCGTAHGAYLLLYGTAHGACLLLFYVFASGTHTSRPSIVRTEPPICSRTSFMQGRLNPISTGSASGDGLPLIISLMLSACLRRGMVCSHYGSVRRMIRSDTIRVWLSFRDLGISEPASILQLIAEGLLGDA